MPTMREILAAAAQGTYAEVDGIGNVVEQMFRDFLDLQQAHEAFLRKYGHIVKPKPLQEAAPQQRVAAPQQAPMPAPAHAPPPYAGEPRVMNGQQIHDDRYPPSPSPISPEEAEQLERSVQDLARRLVRARPV